MTPGTRLGPYEIGDLLGAGGMGEVYRARDARLNRDVAVKVLPVSMASDSDRLRRFEQEARATGALNHPNILAVYDVGSEHGRPYLVSELLDGDTLRERLREGPLAPRRALDYAIQIAHGLTAAHAKGIIHRDLKPENLFVTRSGQVKILDFGLAKEQAAAAGYGGVTLTDPGTMVGTVSYMSPEQIRCEPVDHRSDIFAFGAILYEMLTGQTAFREDTAAETMSAILKKEPAELADLSRNFPPAIDRVLRYCLEKDPAQRFHSMRDLAFALEAISDSPSSMTRQGRPPGPGSIPRYTRKTALVFAAGLLLGLTAGALAALWGWRQEPAAAPSFRYLTYSGHDSSPAASPDGRTLAFTSDRDGQQRIWLKQLSTGGEVALTDGPDDLPRFSPDGSMILFVRNGDLYRTPILGPDPRKILDDVAAADWSPDGREIAFLRVQTEGTLINSIVGLVEASGSNAREIARLRGERLAHPRWSPDGGTIAVVPSVIQGGLAGFVLLVPKTGANPRRIEIPRGWFGISSAAWTANGREVVYSVAESAAGAVVGNSGSSSWVFRHNVRTGEARRAFWSPFGASLLDIAGPGRLVFDTRSPRESLREFPPAAPAGSRWLTRGNSSDRQPSYSPDGQRVIFSSNRSGNLDLWELSVKTGAVRRLTDDAAEDWDPAFTDQGKSILWSSNRGGNFEIWMAHIDGSGARQITRDGVDAENPTATPDGQWIVYSSGHPTKAGLWKIRRDGTQATQLVSGFVGLPEVCPAGQYVSFVTNFLTDSATLRVIRLADGAPAPFEVQLAIRNSSLGGSIGRSRWMPDGRAIAFIGQDERGVSGVYVQDFAPGKDTSNTRRPMCCFDPEIATESFGISPVDRRVTVASWEQISSLIVADKVPGLSK